MNWQQRLERLLIDDQLSTDDVTIVRTAYNRFAVITPQQTAFIGGRNFSWELAVVKVVELITGIPQSEPCTRCGQPRVADSYCRSCFNRIHAEGKRKRR